LIPVGRVRRLGNHVLTLNDYPRASRLCISNGLVETTREDSSAIRRIRNTRDSSFVPLFLQFIVLFSVFAQFSNTHLPIQAERHDFSVIQKPGFKD